MAARAAAAAAGAGTPDKATTVGAEEGAGSESGAGAGAGSWAWEAATEYSGHALRECRGSEAGAGESVAETAQGGVCSRSVEECTSETGARLGARAGAPASGYRGSEAGAGLGARAGAAAAEYGETELRLPFRHHAPLLPPPQRAYSETVPPLPQRAFSETIPLLPVPLSGAHAETTSPLPMPQRALSETASVRRPPSEDYSKPHCPLPSPSRSAKHESRALYQGMVCRGLLGVMTMVSFYFLGVLSGCKEGSLSCEGPPGLPYMAPPRGPHMHELASRNGVVSRLVLPAVTPGTAVNAGTGYTVRRGGAGNTERKGTGEGGSRGERGTEGGVSGRTEKGGKESTATDSAFERGERGTLTPGEVGSDSSSSSDAGKKRGKEGTGEGGEVESDRMVYGTTLYRGERLTMGVPLAPMADMPLWFRYMTSASHQGASNHEADVIPVRALRALMSRIAVNNTVIVVSTNLGFFNMTLNVLCRLEDLGATNVLTWALDEGSAKALRDRSLPYYYDTAAFSVSNYTSYFDLDYIRMMIERPAVWWRLLATGYDLIFIDSDVVLFENPMGLFPRQGDIEGQIDAKSWDEAERGERGDGVPDMCAGAFWLRSSPTTLRFLDQMKGAIEKHAVRERFDDQYALNSIIRDPNLALITNRGAMRGGGKGGGDIGDPKVAVVRNREPSKVGGEGKDGEGKFPEEEEEAAGGRLRVRFVEASRIMGGRLEKFSTREVDKHDYYNVTFVFKGRGGEASRRVRPGLFHLNGRGLEYIKLKMLKKSGWWEVQEDGYCRTKEGMRREIALLSAVEKEREAAAAEAMAAEMSDEDGDRRRKRRRRGGPPSASGNKKRGTLDNEEGGANSPRKKQE